MSAKPLIVEKLSKNYRLGDIGFVFGNRRSLEKFFLCLKRIVESFYRFRSSGFVNEGEVLGIMGKWSRQINFIKILVA